MYKYIVYIYIYKSYIYIYIYIYNLNSIVHIFIYLFVLGGAKNTISAPIPQISLARQAAVPPPRHYTETSTNYTTRYHRKPSGETFETIAISIQKRCRMYEKTSLERWRRRNTIFWGGRMPWNPRPDSDAPFWVAKSQTRREKCHQQIILKTSTPKH